MNEEAKAEVAKSILALREKMEESRRLFDDTVYAIAIRMLLPEGSDWKKRYKLVFSHKEMVIRSTDPDEECARIPMSKVPKEILIRHNGISQVEVLRRKHAESIIEKYAEA